MTILWMLIHVNFKLEAVSTNSANIISSTFALSTDYDTKETVTCQSYFIYELERQRNLQHFIQIEKLPTVFKKVTLPSGNSSNWTSLSNLSLLRNLCCLWFPSSSATQENSIYNSGSLVNGWNLHP